jgi:creatinine amidohydrolase
MGDTLINWLNAATATWHECRDFLKRRPYAILPLGATEQHGPHLPQNTDTLLAEALALETARRSVGLVLPAIPIGYSWVWRDYPGSLTFSFDTFRAVIKDIARSLDRNDCQALMIITAHGANPQPLKYTARELVDEIEMKILNVFYPDLQRIMADAESPMWLPMNFHAEEFETSLMLHLHPELVRMEKAVREYPRRSINYEMSSLPMGALSESGVFGDATAATAEKGERWFKACVERMAGVWQEFLSLPV